MLQGLLGFLESSFVSDSERLQVSREVSRLNPLLTGLLKKYTFIMSSKKDVALQCTVVLYVDGNGWYKQISGWHVFK